MGRQNAVSAIPMDVIWDSACRVLDASRVGYVSPEQIGEQLRAGDVLVLVADIGADLLRLSGQDVYPFWKEEAQPRVVTPEKAEAGFQLSEFPGEYCYVVSSWAGADLDRPVLLFERYH